MIYLLHFDKPYQHAQHYVGSAEDVDARLAVHQSGSGDAKLTRAAAQAGCVFTVARTWPGGRKEERALKGRPRGSRTSWRPKCPICRAESKCAREA